MFIDFWLIVINMKKRLSKKPDYSYLIGGYLGEILEASIDKLFKDIKKELVMLVDVLEEKTNGDVYLTLRINNSTLSSKLTKKHERTKAKTL